MAGDGGVRGGQQLADAVRAEVEVTVVAVVPEQRKYQEALSLSVQYLTCCEC